MGAVPKLSAAEYAELPRRTKADLERIIVEEARTNINVMAAYAFQIKNQPIHEFQHAIIDAQKSRFNTWDAPVEHGKTTQHLILRPIYDLGQNIHEMIALVSSSPDLPRNALKVIRAHIQENERLQRVFPHLKIAEKTKSSLILERPRSTQKDASIVAMGIEGAVLGRRWTKLTTDDILRFATTWTEHEREKIWQRVIRELLGRLTSRATHTDVGTPWVGSDARHKLRRRPGYVFLRFDGWTGEVRDIVGRLVKTFEGGLWPEPTFDRVTGTEFGWPRERLERARREMPGHEFDRQIRCIALSAAMEIFGVHLDACKKLGQGIQMREETAFDGKVRIASRRPEPSWRMVFTGVDLAIEKHEASHDTAFYTGAIADRQKHVIELRRGKIEGPNIIRNMIDIVSRYPMHLGFRVESNQGQKYLKQFIDEPGVLEALGATPEEADRIRIYPHMTGKNKMQEGIGVRAMNLDFERKRWPIPCDDDLGSCALIQEWVDGLKAFDPVSHSDDMVMASWLFWEQTRDFGVGGGNWERFGIFVP
jgi:hypothetical protein